MKTYEYVAWDTEGACREGVRQAHTQEEILSFLRDENMTPVSVTEKAGEMESDQPKARYKAVKSGDLATFCWQLGTMVGGGLSITVAMETIAEEMPNKYFEYVLKNISQRMQNGQPMADGVREYPKVFNKLACAMVQAAETSGTLTTSLARLAEYYENKDKLAKKVRGAMIYPIFVVGFIILIIITMMTLIIPRFKIMFDQFKGELPAFTKGFMAVYYFLTNNILYLLLGAALVVTATILFGRTPKGKRAFSKLALDAPLFGPIKRMAFVAMFCKTFATLINSGVSVFDTFGLLAGMTDNILLREGIAKTREKIVEGMTIAKSMELAEFFPNVAVKMTQIGEQSGSLGAVLDKTSQYYEKKVDTLVSMMLSMLEPIMIVSVGAIVLVVILAMYLPIFSMSV